MNLLKKRENFMAIGFAIIVLAALLIVVALLGNGSGDKIDYFPVGAISVVSNPDGSNVYLNGSLIGISALNQSNISTGSYDLKISKEGYLDYVQTIQIVENSTLNISADLFAKNGSLEILTNPTGAMIFFNLVESGQSNMFFENFLPGEYELLVVKEGYESYRTKFLIENGKKTSLMISLNKLNNTIQFGSIYADSFPSGANVYVDGNYMGVTPIKVEKLSIGEHKIRFVKHKYSTVATKFEIFDDKVKYLNATLYSSDVSGNLNIDTNPTDADIYIDNEYLGRTYLESIVLFSGPHRIVVNKTGYYQYVTSFDITAGQFTNLNLSLVKVPESIPIRRI